MIKPSQITRFRRTCNTLCLTNTCMHIPKSQIQKLSKFRTYFICRERHNLRLIARACVETRAARAKGASISPRDVVWFIIVPIISDIHSWVSVMARQGRALQLSGNISFKGTSIFISQVTLLALQLNNRCLKALNTTTLGINLHIIHNWIML